MEGFTIFLRKACYSRGRRISVSELRSSKHCVGKWDLHTVYLILFSVMILFSQNTITVILPWLTDQAYNHQTQRHKSINVWICLSLTAMYLESVRICCAPFTIDESGRILEVTWSTWHRSVVTLLIIQQLLP